MIASGPKRLWSFSLHPYPLIFLQEGVWGNLTCFL